MIVMQAELAAGFRLNLVVGVGIVVMSVGVAALSYGRSLTSLSSMRVKL